MERRIIETVAIRNISEIFLIATKMPNNITLCYTLHVTKRNLYTKSQ